MYLALPADAPSPQLAARGGVPAASTVVPLPIPRRERPALRAGSRFGPSMLPEPRGAGDEGHPKGRAAGHHSPPIVDRKP